MNDSEEDYFETQLSSFTFQKSAKKESNSKVVDQRSVARLEKAFSLQKSKKNINKNTESSNEHSNENLNKNSNGILNGNSSQISNTNKNPNNILNQNSNEIPNETSNVVLFDHSNHNSNEIVLENSNKSLIEISNENPEQHLSHLKSTEFSNGYPSNRSVPAQKEVNPKNKKEKNNKNKSKKRKKEKDQKNSNEETKNRIVQEQTEYIHSLLKDSKTGMINLQSLQKFVNSNEENGYDEETILVI